MNNVQVGENFTAYTNGNSVEIHGPKPIWGEQLVIGPNTVDDTSSIEVNTEKDNAYIDELTNKYTKLIFKQLELANAFEGVLNKHLKSFSGGSFEKTELAVAFQALEKGGSLPIYFIYGKLVDVVALPPPPHHVTATTLNGEPLEKFLLSPESRLNLDKLNDLMEEPPPAEPKNLS